MLYGDGLQTWEYSPANALRSYFYLGKHTICVIRIDSCSILIIIAMLMIHKCVGSMLPFLFISTFS